RSRRSLRGELQPDDARDDQPEADHAPGVGRLAEQHDAEDRGADRADPDPDRVGSSHRQRLHRDAEQAEADRHGHHRADRGPQPGEAVRALEADGPADLEQAGKGEDDPGHAGLLSRRQRRSYTVVRWRTASNRTTPAATETLRL